MVLDDLENGVISLDNSDSAHDLYHNMYKHTAEFIVERVEYEQFRDRLRDHRAQVGRRHEAAQWEMAALAHDRQLFPIRTHNDRGEKKFYLSTAGALLAEDVKQEKHKTMKPSELRASRPEYAEFPLKIFDGRIRQAIRRERMVNWRSDKREELEKEQRQRREKFDESTGNLMQIG